MPLHHVREEELPAGALPQLEARGDCGALHVRHPAEQPGALLRPGGARRGLPPQDPVPVALGLAHVGGVDVRQALGPTMAP